MLLDTPICDFGWKAPDFKLSDSDGTTHALSEHLGDKGALIMFICNHCPYVQAIAGRLKRDTDELIDQGIGVIAIMSNDYHSVPTDGPTHMKHVAKNNGWQFPYLVDEDQSVGKQYGAVCTPDFFGLNRFGTLQYRGRLDDAHLNDTNNRTRELVNAMKLIAETDNGPTQQTASMGCSIKWR